MVVVEPLVVALWRWWWRPWWWVAALYGGGGLDSAPDRNGIAISKARNGHLYLDVYDRPKRYATYVEGAEADFNDGKWHHVVGIYDGKSIGIYLDGQLSKAGLKEIGAIQIDWTNCGHRVGRRAERGPYNWFWRGSVDEVMIFSRALEYREIGELYSRQRL